MFSGGNVSDIQEKKRKLILEYLKSGMFTDEMRLSFRAALGYKKWAVLDTIISLAEDGKAFFNVPKLKLATGIDKEAFIKIRKELIDMGLVDYIPGVNQGIASEFFIHFEKLVDLFFAGRAKVSRIFASKNSSSDRQETSNLLIGKPKTDALDNAEVFGKPKTSELINALAVGKPKTDALENHDETQYLSPFLPDNAGGERKTAYNSSRGICKKSTTTIEGGALPNILSYLDSSSFFFNGKGEGKTEAINAEISWATSSVNENLTCGESEEKNPLLAKAEEGPDADARCWTQVLIPEPLMDLGFERKSVINQVKSNQTLTAQELQDSLDYFCFDYLAHKSEVIRNPLSYFMKIIAKKNVPYSRPPGYKTPQQVKLLFDYHFAKSLTTLNEDQRFKLTGTRNWEDQVPILKLDFKSNYWKKNLPKLLKNEMPDATTP